MLDVSDQKRAEAILSESERLFREMANVAPAMIWKNNEKHECTFLSQSWLDFTGQRNDDGLGAGWLDAVHPDDRTLTNKVFLSSAANGKSFKIDYRLRTKDGDYRWAIDAGNPLFTEEGKFCGFIGSVIDDHDRHEFQSALSDAIVRAESSNESKGAFLANMSHEIRTPMTAILGFADLLDQNEEYSKDPKLTADAVQTIRSNANHLLTIINDILDMSKIEAGKMNVEFIETSPMKVVEEVISLMKPRAVGAGITIDLQYESVIPEIIRTDPTRLRQILLNLMGNAINFSEVGGVKLSMRFFPEEKSLQFCIMDTGIGMTAEQCEVISKFDSFSQADGSTTRKFGGTGLGLKISNSLAKMLGGGIALSSRIGEGSTFVLTIGTGDTDNDRQILPSADALPSQTAVEAKSQPEKIDENTKPLKGVNILLVEDGPDNQRLISYHLRKEGAEVTIAENGLEAVEMIKTDFNKFGLVFMDLQMPILDLKQANACLSEPYFYSAAATVPAGLD